MQLRYGTVRFLPVLLAAALAGGLLSAQVIPPAPGSAAGQEIHNPVPLVVIDPGHGGDDLGVQGAGGVPEKRLALDLAHTVARALERRTGIPTILTRGDDRAVEPDDRAAVANSSNADLFISLHFNASLRATSAGAEVYHHRPSPPQATGESPSGPRWLTVPGAAPRLFDLRRWDRVQDRHAERSATLARLLVEALSGRLPMGARTLQSIPSRVLAGLVMPTVLVEVAFLTHPGEAAAARSDAFQAQVAEAIADAAIRFHDRPQRDDTR